MTRLAALWKKDPGVVVSGGAHGLALVLLLVSFSHAPPLEDAHEATSVEMVTTSELNEIMNGEPTAKLMPKPQRRVDKVAALEAFKPDPPTPEARTDTPPPPAPGKANDDPGPDEKPPEQAPEKAAAAPPPPPPRPADPAPPLPVVPPAPTPPERPVEKAEAPQPPKDAPTPPSRPEPVKPPPSPEAEAVEPTPPPRPKPDPIKPDPKPEPPRKVAKLPPAKPVPRPRPVEVKEAKVVTPPPLPPPPKKPEPTTLDRVAQLLDTLKPDVLKPDAAKPDAAKPDAAKPPKPPVRPRAGNEAKVPPRDDFSLAKISALLDHEAPQHKASTGRALAQTASLGAPNSHAEKMSPQLQAQIDNWFVDHYIGCWHYFGTGGDLGYIPKVRVIVTADGALMERPQLINPPSNQNLRSLADSAMRAVKDCDPLPIPAWIKPHYQMWQNHVIDFDPKEKA